MPATEIRQGPVGTLRAHPADAHAHSKKRLAQIARSIQQFGFTVPIIIDENNVTLAGHGRLLAAKHLGLRLVPVRSGILSSLRILKCLRAGFRVRVKNKRRES